VGRPARRAIPGLGIKRNAATSARLARASSWESSDASYAVELVSDLPLRLLLGLGSIPACIERPSAWLSPG